MTQKKSTMAAMVILCFALLIPGICLADAGEWTWMSGSDIRYQNGVCGVKGTPDAANMPGAHYNSVSWADSTGNLWLFGGDGRTCTDSSGVLHDLWRYNIATGIWTWMSGSTDSDELGVYGTKGIPDAANMPGSRYYSTSWIDSDDNLWLFGGWAYASDYGEDEDMGYLNDLWRYDTDNGTWTWISGSDIVNQPGVYGEKGTPAVGNVPGARESSVSWADSEGNLWLFGGYGLDTSDGSGNRLNDLWRYNIATGTWTWVSGWDTAYQEDPVYGEKGIPSAANIIRESERSLGWIDSDDNLWLFGGLGRDSTGLSGQLNDLWRYNISTDMWTWVSGSDTANASGIYGTKGTPAALNAPGARYYSISWIDSDDNLWLFGGTGFSSTDTRNQALNDLWSYDPVANMWTWVGGLDTADQATVYGDKGIASATNLPGARHESISFVDNVGNFWFFGGYGADSVGDDGSHNDLWRYEMVAGCENDSDCDDGIFCNGAETCDNGTCVESENPCDNSTLLCDEDNTTCVECLVDDNCTDDMPLCEETDNICVECVSDIDCSDNLTCTDGMCLFPCALSIKYKEIKSEKLFKPRKRTFKITGDENFDPEGEIDFGLFEVFKTKVKNKKGKLKVKAKIPVGFEPGMYPISVGDCSGEIEITGIMPQ